MTEKMVHIKWIGPNDPVVRIVRNDARLYLTKRELIALMQEIESFVDYYQEDFTEGKLDNETSAEDMFDTWGNHYG
jgi:hypothetical protein